jgi:hypothetical protein
MIIARSYFYHCKGNAKLAPRLAQATGDICPPDSLPLRDGYFTLSPIENLLEFGNAMAHTRMHIGLGTFDVVV